MEPQKLFWNKLFLRKQKLFKKIHTGKDSKRRDTEKTTDEVASPNTPR